MASIVSLPDSDAVRKYQVILKGKGGLFRVSGDRPILGKYGEPSRYFADIFRERYLIFDFFREVWLIKPSIVCQSFNVYMKLHKKGNVSDGFSWICSVGIGFFKKMVREKDVVVKSCLGMDLGLADLVRWCCRRLIC